MTREEILGLSKMSEGEQYLLLAPLFQTRTEEEICPRCDRDLVFAREESLPDLADRLFGAVDRHKKYDVMREIYKQEFPGCRFMSDDIFEWFAMKSKPIHRIQAALLAKEGV